VFCLAWGALAGAVAQPMKLGSATVFLKPQSGDKGMPSARWRTDEMLKRAAPTNQWYSTLVFNEKPEVIYAQPLTVKATPAGFELALPSKEVVPTERRDVEIRYPHRDPIVIAPVAFEAGPAKLSKSSDWAIDIAMARDADQFTATVAHGSPYVSFTLSRGDVRVKVPAGSERVAGAADPRVLALRVKTTNYAVFGPTGVKWESPTAGEWIGRLPAGSGYVSAAALPDDRADTLALFVRHAYAFIQDTRVDWRYVQAASQVETTFTATARAMEGDETRPLLGLYPHHWLNNASVEGKLGPAFDSVRGKIRLLPAAQFKMNSPYAGFVPYWPGVKDSPKLADLKDMLDKEKRTARRLMLQEGKGAYWQGKGLQRTMVLMNIAEQQGDIAGRDELLAMMKKRVQEWFTGESDRGYFHLDKSLGAVASYPDEFFTVEQINDHHFTYGYWIRVMAEIALRDPAWASSQQWGGMVDLLVADIATTERGRADFPFLRNFDPYEGHSWASGIGIGAYGNNQESSSEAINAWAGLILWAELSGNTALRDAGVYLYATESQAIDHYWFDIHGVVFPPEYKNVEVSQLFGGQMVHNTWWTDEPRQIKGINLLPLTSASMYLARDPKFILRNLDALKPEMEIYAARNSKPRNPPPADVWQDVFAKYAALADPARGMSSWDRWGSVELGESRTSAMHWLMSLADMGPPDLGVTADTPFYSVFKRTDGQRTYLAFNPGKAALAVRFSDGKTMSVAPGTLARSN
jgi:endoglucanase Acf2